MLSYCFLGVFYELNGDGKSVALVGLTIGFNFRKFRGLDPMAINF
jgi:hypothetical protein